MQSLLLVCLAWVVAQAQVIAPGKCPPFVPKEDFDIPQYTGKWFEILRFETPYERNQRCNYAEYADNGNGTVSVHNAGLGADGSFIDIYGYVEPSDVPGALILHLDGVPLPGDYNVLDTDYTGWTAVFSCGNLFGLGHTEQAWVLAREPFLELEQYRAALQVFDGWGIDITKFTQTDQQGCDFS